MKTTPLVSVIVPVYKVEEYIHECIESILNQTYSNIEVLIVNDGTPDRSIEVIRDLLVDPRVSVINQHNQGLSAARNTGLENASGRYVSFIDSDDKVKPRFIEDLVIDAQNTGADIVRGNFRDFEGEIPEGWVADFDILPMEGTKALNKFLNQNVSFVVWSSLYSRSFLEANNLRFTNGILLEDGDFTARAYMAADTVSTVSTPNYQYRIRPGSILTTNNAQRMSDSESVVILKFLNMYNTTKNRKVKYQIRNSIYAFMRDWTRILVKNNVKIDLDKSGFNDAAQLVKDTVRRRSIKERIKFGIKLLAIKIKY